ncbi:MAG: PadR family transcriptional regulator [Geodermatophilaceae bacterium]|nr:PadR family transcriptional regulator [Geodermatophilaceae bacterium]
MSTYASSSSWRDASTAWNSLLAAAAEAARELTSEHGGRAGARRRPRAHEHGPHHDARHDPGNESGHDHGHRHDHRRGHRHGGGFDRSDGGPGPFGPGGLFGPPGGPGHGHGHGGPGFGHPGGPWRARGRGRGRGARRRGDVRAAILVLLDEQPRHGYELISEISERSGGVWRPSPGTVYPTLSQLEDEGLVRLERLDGRKTATLTDEGRAYVEENRAQLGEPWTEVAGDVRAENRTLAGVIAQVGMAASTVALHGTPEQATRAAEILERARQELYGLMAQPKPASPDTPQDAPGKVQGASAEPSSPTQD